MLSNFSVMATRFTSKYPVISCERSSVNGPGGNRSYAGLSFCVVTIPYHITEGAFLFPKIKLSSIEQA